MSTNRSHRNCEVAATTGVNSNPTMEDQVFQSAGSGFDIKPKVVIIRKRSKGKGGAARSAVTIQPATIDQLPQLMEFSSRALADIAKRVGQIEMTPWVGQLQMFIARDDRRLFVAVDDGQIIGWNPVLVVPVFFAPSVRFVQSLGFWVEPDRRSEDITTRLAAASEEWARSVGARFVDIGVFDPTGRGDGPSGYTRSESHFLKGLG